MKKLSIVIPCYNESNTIENLLNKVEGIVLSDIEKEIIIVDDYSTDDTRVKLKKYQDRMIVVYQTKNGGKGTAVRRGLEEVTGDYVIIQDADLEYDPDEIKDLVSAVKKGERDIIYGSRNLHHEERSGFVAPRLGVWFITKLFNFLYGVNLTDVWTCYKLFPSEMKGSFPDGGFDSELIFTAKMALSGLKFSEVPISHYPRDISEGKKIRYRDGFYVIFLLITYRLLHLRKPVVRKPKDVLLLLCCPVCKNNLEKTDKGYLCNQDGLFKADNLGRPFLIDEKVFELNTNEHKSGVSGFKLFLKQFPRLYYGIWHVFCPVLMMVNGPKKILSFLSSKEAILDVGSGPERLGDEFINVDVFPFPEVDVVADARNLPFKDGSVDGLVSESMLEHVSNPNEVANEMVRVLIKGGYLYVSAPFIHPYHASPNDFTRWTTSGLKSLFRDLEVVETGVRSGPWSALLMFLVYWLGVIFSFGFKKLSPILAHVFMLVLGPIKYLDLIFMYLPGSEAVATHLYFIGKKK